eukprot:scaffold13354_cov181-Alexandrium_tamarense.AAC.8
MLEVCRRGSVASAEDDEDGGRRRFLAFVLEERKGTRGMLSHSDLVKQVLSTTFRLLLIFVDLLNSDNPAKALAYCNSSRYPA